MSKTGIARLFSNGRSQAVRLPREFRFSGDRVRVRKVGDGVLLEPLATDLRQWFAALDESGADPLFKRGRRQPKPPKRPAFR